MRNVAIVKKKTTKLDKTTFFEEKKIFKVCQKSFYIL